MVCKCRLKKLSNYIFWYISVHWISFYMLRRIQFLTLIVKNLRQNLLKESVLVQPISFGHDQSNLKVCQQMSANRIDFLPFKMFVIKILQKHSIQLYTYILMYQ